MELGKTSSSAIAQIEELMALHEVGLTAYRVKSARQAAAADSWFGVSANAPMSSKAATLFAGAGNARREGPDSSFDHN